MSYFDTILERDRQLIKLADTNKRLKKYTIPIGAFCHICNTQVEDIVNHNNTSHRVFKS